jgi:hypothetical protein
MYKIQHETVNGWADLKTNTDDGTYEVDVFTAKENAEQEMKDLVELVGDDPNSYRVVDIDTQEDYNMY